jgi:hypothetical protein
MNLPSEIGSRIPTWVRKEGIRVLVEMGVGATEARKVSVPVPKGTPVKDDDGKERPAKNGEMRKLGEFVSERTVHRWHMSPEVAALRKAKTDAWFMQMQTKTRKTGLLAMDQLNMLVQGLRPVLDEHGRVSQKPVAVVENGQTVVKMMVVYRQVQESVQVQAIQAHLAAMRQVEDAPATKVEMSHSGTIANPQAALSDEELQRKIAENLKAMGAANGLG